MISAIKKRTENAEKKDAKNQKIIAIIKFGAIHAKLIMSSIYAQLMSPWVVFLLVILILTAMQANTVTTMRL